MNKIVKIVNGYPSAVASKDNYREAIAEVGIENAHRKMLVELKAWFDASPEYAHRPAAAAVQADLIESAFSIVWYDDNLNGIPIKKRDQMFANVFGKEGKRIVEAEQRRADEDVARFMREEGIKDEDEARRLLVEEMVGGMQFFIENKDKILNLANTLKHANDVVRREEDKDKLN